MVIAHLWLFKMSHLVIFHLPLKGICSDYIDSAVLQQCWWLGCSFTGSLLTMRCFISTSQTGATPLLFFTFAKRGQIDAETVLTKGEKGLKMPPPHCGSVAHFHLCNLYVTCQWAQVYLNDLLGYWWSTLWPPLHQPTLSGGLWF